MKNIRAIMDYGLLTAEGDLEEHGRQIVKCGANMVRFVINYLHNDNEIPNPITPFLIAGYANEPREGRSVPIYDLTKRRPEFVHRLRTLADWTKRYKQTPWICFDDRCSWAPGTWKEFLNVWYCNTHSYPGALSGDWKRHGSGGTQDLALNGYRFAMMRDVVEIFRAVGHTELWGEVENEHGEEPGEAYTLEMDLAWYAQQTELLRDAGFNVIIGSARDPVTTKIMWLRRPDGSRCVDFYDAHNIRDKRTADAAFLATEPAVTLLNTDGAMGTAAEGSIFGGHSVNIPQAEEIGEASKQGVGFCYLSQLTFGEIICTNLDRTEYPQLKAMSEASGRTEPEPEKVYLNICEESRLLPNPYCPVKFAQAFVKGTEPTTTCQVHKAPVEPPNPPEEGKMPTWLNWLIGPNSFWTKNPLTSRFLLGLVLGVILGAWLL